MSDALTNAAFNRLSRTALNNPSVTVRKETLLELRKLDHAQVDDVLREVIASDSDAGVRDLAQNLLRKHEINAMLKAGRFDAVPEAFPMSEELIDDFSFDEAPARETTTTSGDDWTCRFCDTVNPAMMRECASCGAAREVETKRPTVFPGVRTGDTFFLHPYNQKFINQTSGRLASKANMAPGCMLLFILPFVAAGLVVIFFAVREWNRYQILSTTGVTTRGEYTGSRIDNDDDGTTYYLSYRFETGEQVYIDEHSVSYDLYRSGEKGAPVDILYAPSDPSISRIAGTNTLTTPLFLTIFSILWNLISWGFLFVVVNGTRRDRLLAREGLPVQGEVLEARGTTSSKSNYTVKVKYGFTPPDSRQRITKTESSQRNDLKGRSLPKYGTPVTVLYRNVKHFRML